MILSEIYSQTLILLLAILLLFSKSIMSSEGIFEIHIKNYFLFQSLDLQKCCPKEEKLSSNTCESQCNIFMEICLSIYQKVPHRYACDIGETMIITDILGNNKLSVKSNRDHFIKVRERWNKNFNILVRIKHRDKRTKKEEVIVTLSSAEENVRPSSDWITKQLSTPKDHFQLFVSFRYSCSKYHYGDMCDKYCKPSHSGPGHYNCSKAGDIICHYGYNGSYCDKVVCQNQCNHGTCVGPNLCRCFTGWTGDSCEKCIPYPGCINGGCRKDEKVNDLLPMTCECKKGWGGMFCNIDLNYCSNNLNICLNGGECQNFGNINTNQQYRCICKPGYSGTHCEKAVVNCVVRECLNDGICKIDKVRKSSKCNCKESFYGDRCQFNMTSCAEFPCIGSNSKCFPDSKVGFKCDCATGFIGRNCEIDKDECSINPCLNGGMCIDRASGFRCVCPVGFSGNRCQVNKNDCQKLSCMNGAKCMDRANRIDCECTPGWTGITCNQNINECGINQPCKNGGKCEDTPGSYICECLPTWGGNHCTMKIMHNNTKTIDKKCKINPCNNNGLCFLSPKSEDILKKSLKYIGGAYYCICPPGFTGELCQKIIIANGSIVDIKLDSLSTPLILITNKSPKNSLTLINLIIISIGIPAILLILIIISLIWCKTSKKFLKLQRTTKYQNNAIIKSHNFSNNSDINFLNNKLNQSQKNLFKTNRLPLSIHKLNNLSTDNNFNKSSNDIPIPYNSHLSYACSLMPYTPNKNLHRDNKLSLSQKSNFFPLKKMNIDKEVDKLMEKSISSKFDRDGDPESIYQNDKFTKDSYKLQLKSSLDSNINIKEESRSKTLIGSTSEIVKRKKEKNIGHGLCSSQNSLLESSINENLRSAVSQQFHQPSSSQLCEDNYFKGNQQKILLNTNQYQKYNRNIESEWPTVNCKLSPDCSINSNGKKQYTDNKYVLYYTRSVLPPKIDYNLISHPNFQETSCFLDSVGIYPSLRSIITNSTTVEDNISQNL